jgi:ketosteroid isomerase-like protein
MATAGRKATQEGEIRRLMEQQAEAVRAQDSERLLADYAPDVDLL